MKHPTCKSRASWGVIHHPPKFVVVSPLLPCEQKLAAVAQGGWQLTGGDVGPWHCHCYQTWKKKKSKLVSRKKKKNQRKETYRGHLLSPAFNVPALCCPQCLSSLPFILPIVHWHDCSLSLFIVEAVPVVHHPCVHPHHPCCLSSPVHGYHCRQHLQFPL